MTRMVRAGDDALDISGTVMDNNACGGHGRTAEEVMQDAVKQAWMEAEEETGAFFTVFGLYIKDGKHAHMTQMGIERGIK